MDDRLFVDEKLYCEGRPKPWFRGKIHLASLVFIAPAIYFSQNNIWSHINILTNFCCFGVSGIYHTFTWSPRTEIVLQKLDHQMISAWCVGMMMPIAFNMFEPGVRAKFLTALLATFLANSYAIWSCKPSTIIASSIPATLLLFLDECWKHMNSVEWISMLLVFGFQIAGTIAYTMSNKGYTIFGNDEIYGYHELFHTLSLFAAFFVYMANYHITLGP